MSSVVRDGGPAIVDLVFDRKKALFLFVLKESVSLEPWGNLRNRRKVVAQRITLLVQ